MESLKQFSGVEGCSSSESGWTMYISSPMEEDQVECSNDIHDDDDDDDHDNKHQIKKHNSDKKNEDDDSDDSLASDASSGPSHPQHTYPHSQGSHVTSRSKQDKSYNVNKSFQRKNTNKHEKKSVKNNTRKN